MTTLSSNIPELVMAGLNMVIFEKYESYPEQFSRIYNVLESSKQYEDDVTMTGLGVFPVKPEGSSIVYDDPMRGFSKRYTHVTYALGFRVTREMMADDLYGPMRKMAKALGRSARQTVEIQAASLFNNGFSSTTGSPDGKPLFATDHPLVGGGTARNELSTPADLSVTSLQQAINDFEDTVDDRGLLLAIKPKLLVVPSELKWQAHQLLMSPLLPGTADNDANPLKDEGLSYFVWNYLTDPDAWFLIAEPDDHEVKFFWRERFTVEAAEDFDTKDHKISGIMRFSYGWSDWRGVFGSPGA
jgi:phage major head subunit gpT-like protein